jgi:phosphatidylserine/phosphatidylglycerophosphate/cardiolipin synthase-like enzyme
MILENRKYQEFGSDFQKLVERLSGTNFQIRSDQELGTNYVHSKVFLTDKQFIIQTANLSFTSFTKNREYFFISSHSGVLASLHKIFQKDRKAEPLEQKDLHPNLVVCPLNCRAVIEHLITHAKKSIVIQTQYITDPVLKNLLASKNSLDVRILVSDTKDNVLLRQFL